MSDTAAVPRTDVETRAMTGSEVVLRALVEQDVEVVFGYPGGAVLPIYDALFKQNSIRHILVRHEQGAVHAAEGYARSTGRVGVVLVTSGPGATNTVTGLTDALMDSVPVVCLTGQVPTHMIGNDAFQEADTVGITRPCTKHNYLVKSGDVLARVVHEANLAMHGCDLMIALGSRFDDRVTGRLDRFSPGSKKVHIDIDPSSINKNVPVDVAIVADAGRAIQALLACWRAKGLEADPDRLAPWWAQIKVWQAADCLRYRQSGKTIKPQYAIQRLYELTRERETYITTEVGQHQMWAAQHYRFEIPRRWMTSGGLGTMGYGFPAAMGVQVAHPDALVIDIAGEASWVMNMQEMSTVVQYRP